MRWSGFLRVALLFSATVLFLSLAPRVTLAQAATAGDIPPELRPWQDWALYMCNSCAARMSAVSMQRRPPVVCVIGSAPCDRRHRDRRGIP